MPAKRRADDPVGEDHIPDRNTDWRNAPRHQLIVAIYALLGALSCVGSFAYLAVSDRFQKLEASISDQRAKDVGAAIEMAADAKKRVLQHEEILSDMQEQLRHLKRAQDATRAEVGEVKRLVQQKGGR